MPLTSPYDFTKTDTNRVKLFGGGVCQIPQDQGNPVPRGQPPFTYYWHYLYFATVFPDWIAPQMKRIRQNGGNFVRMISSIDGVLMGEFSQSYLENCMTTILNEYRTLGLMAGLTSICVFHYSDIVKPGGAVATLTDMQTSLQSLYNNVYLPNQDIIAYIEAGNNETQSSDVGTSIAMAQFAKTLGTIPRVISRPSSQVSGVYNGSGVDAYTTHWYPTISDYSPTDFQSTFNQMMSSQKSYSDNVPNFLEECNDFAANGSGGLYQAKADLYDSLLAACFSHPDCAGLSAWSIYGNDVDGSSSPLGSDWTIFQPPTQPNGQPAGSDGITDYNPALFWASTAASNKLQSYGPHNRNLTAKLSLPSSQVISASDTLIELTATTGSVSNPTITNFVFNTYFRKTVMVKLVGTLSVSGPATLTFYARDLVNNGLTSIGSASVTGANVYFSLGGSLASNPNGVALEIHMITASGTASLTAMNATMSAGNAPALVTTEPLPIGSKLVRGLDRSLMQRKIILL